MLLPLASSLPSPPPLPVVLTILAVVNLVTWFLFRSDKRRAESGHWRIPERTLLLACTAGGAIAGWFAMATFRHKTRKRLFTAVLYAIVLLHVALWVWVGSAAA